MINNLVLIKDLSDYSNIDLTIDYNILKKPLFHGTNEFILKCTDDIRDQMMTACKTIIEFMNKLFWSPKFDELEKYAAESKNPFLSSSVLTQFGKSTLYEYGNMYFTGNFLSAISFAKLPCGELITHSFYVAKAIKDLMLDSEDGSVQANADHVLNNYDMFASGKSVILAVRDVEFVDLQNERGTDLFLKKIFIEKAYKPSVGDDFEIDDNYRIKNIEKYKISIITEEMFKEGISVFTNISNPENIFNELAKKWRK